MKLNVFIEPILHYKKITDMQKITMAKGDGIGPEIMDAALEIIMAAGARIIVEEIEVGVARRL